MIHSKITAVSILPYYAYATEKKMNSTYKIQCYTRTPIDEQLYSKRLAYSMHIACVINGEVILLNHNTGVLFAKSTVDEHRVMTAKSLRNPYIFRTHSGGFGVVAVRTERNGEDDESSKGCVLLFTTPDFVSYKEVGLVKLCDDYVRTVACEMTYGGYIIRFEDENGRFFKAEIKDLAEESIGNIESAEAFEIVSSDIELEGAVFGNALDVGKEIAERLINKLTVPKNIRVDLPEETTMEELVNVRATAVYSDGTTAIKTVDWDLDSIDENGEINGTVHQDHYKFPLVELRADPNACRWNGKYYFIATSDHDREHTFYIRESETLPELFEAPEHLILDAETYPHIKHQLWAPELHSVDGKLYIFHAATPDTFRNEQSHVMKLKTGGDPKKKEDWEAPKKVVRKDGTPLNDSGITLDMTCFEHRGKLYIAWSHREMTPNELGAWIYIAKADKKEPWRLISDIVPISRPDYGWASNRALIDEGPFPLITDKKIYITFSCSAVDNTYCVGMVSADVDADLLDPLSWKKCNYPILTSHSLVGEFGTGHNSYVTDTNGDVWNVYHGRHGLDAPRSTGVRRVHFDVDGDPRLDLTEENDLDKSLSSVKIKIKK